MKYTNLVQLNKSRRKLKPGDIFVMLLVDGMYVYGRIIDTDASPLGVGGGILIYIYSVRSKERLPVPSLHLTELLLPPVMTNKQPWLQGYFEVVEHRELTPDDRLPQHCFYHDLWKKYFDENGNELDEPVEPVGDFSLATWRSTDDEVSEALGLPQAPWPDVDRHGRPR